MRRFSIAGLQLALGKGDNLDVIEREIRSVKKRFPWLDMVMLPELCTFGPDPAHAKPLPGEAENRYSAIARDLGLWLLPGSMFETRDGQVFNTTPVINPEGAVIARYRKMFPFLPYETGVTPGADFVVFDIPDVGRFGVSICYDMWFPETTRTLAWMGAEVILHPSMTNTVDRDVELSMARSSAATNQCYFFDLNTAGEQGVGWSIFCGPGGEVLYQANATRDIISLEVDLDQVTQCRERGWHGLGQPLKSFRDSDITFPPYAEGAARSAVLDKLGPLERPEARNHQDAETNPNKKSP